MNKNNLKLVYVRPFTNFNKDYYEYEFIFSETPEVVWGVDWTDNTPNLCGDISPEKSTYDLVKKVKTHIPLSVIQENACYSMEYAINRSVALAWLNIEGLEEYPEHRLIFKFGDTYSDVELELKELALEMK